MISTPLLDKEKPALRIYLEMAVNCYYLYLEED